MAVTPVTNFGLVNTVDSYTAVDTEITLTTGHGSRLPDTFPFPLTWWDATTYPNAANDPNREIVIVDGRAGDVLTVTRAGESTLASTKNTAGKEYSMILGITKAMWDAVQVRGLSETSRGLTLQTHPSALDEGLHTVMLVHADSIVMSDGEEVSDWNEVSASMEAVNGVGGIDTGSEENAWYKVHALWDGNAKGLILQRAKDFPLVGSYTSNEDASQPLRFSGDNSDNQIAQGFTVSDSGKPIFVDVKLVRTGFPTGSIWFTIQSSSGGLPTGLMRAVSYTIDASRIPTTASWIRLALNNAASSLSIATTYHLVMHGNYTVSATNYISWRMDGSASTYTGGSKALYDLDTFTFTADADDDMMFRVYVIDNDNPLLVPNGYVSAHIGWALNNVDLVKFIQRGNEWRARQVEQVVNELAATPALIDMQSYLPPMPSVTAILGLTGTGTAVALCACSDIAGTDIDVGGTGSMLTLNSGGVTAEQIADRGDIVVTHSGLMVDATAGADLYALGFKF